MNVYKDKGRSFVSIISHSGTDVKSSIFRAVDLIGGFEKSIKKGDNVLLKPNFNTADPPPGSSDPAFIRGIIELLYEHGAGHVTLGESSWSPTRITMEETGMIKVAEAAGASVMVFDEQPYIKYSVKGSKYLKSVRLPKPTLEFEKIVYAPSIKTHRFADFSLSLKLTMGFVKRGRQRWSMHAGHLREKLAELNLIFRPCLIVMDGRVCFTCGGPMQGPRAYPRVILASGDQIAIDVEAIKVIQQCEDTTLTKSPWSYKQIQHAVELGLGVSNQEQISVIKG